ncbi:DUF6470 family protein [Bacillus pumilus]|uniref:DUF6470 family protein n=1 Tax=Bacillus pumilus TaxID=1408 RepID=UPI00119E7C23|nr:DUF6470 family protein [Bacillus pumilus]
MQIPRLLMQQTYAKLQMSTTPSRQEVEQARAELEIQQPRAVMNMTRTPSKLTIDQTEAFADMDIKSIFRRSEEWAAEGKRAVVEGMGRRAEEGSELIKIENGGNAIAEFAKINGAPPVKQFNIGVIPSFFSVKIHYQPSELQIDVEPQKAIIEATPHKPIVNYQPGKVNIEMLQYPDLKIEVDETGQNGDEV